MRLACIACSRDYAPTEIRYECDCGGLLALRHEPAVFKTLDRKLFTERRTSNAVLDVSGVWRFREVVLPAQAREAVVTHPEGNTRVYERAALSSYAGVERLFFKHEGENPTGSFKDRGMTVAVTQARRLGMAAVACASTGNTSASLAAYAAHAGIPAVVLVPDGKISVGKLAQAVGYGARCLAVKGDFDAAMALVRDAAKHLGVYLVNSVNPFRLEGQKTIIWELLESRGWTVPDWIVVPAGNLGNTSAFGKALAEAHAAGWIDRLPRLAAIQARGANPFYLSYKEGFAAKKTVKAETVATAIRIGDPVNFAKATRVIEATDGLVEEVDDPAIMAAKGVLDRAGIGCEPASAAALAGTKKLREAGVIGAGDEVVCILTGHMLKDPDAVLAAAGGAKLQTIDPTLKAMEAALK